MPQEDHKRVPKSAKRLLRSTQEAPRWPQEGAGEPLDPLQNRALAAVAFVLAPSGPKRAPRRRRVGPKKHPRGPRRAPRRRKRTPRGRWSARYTLLRGFGVSEGPPRVQATASGEGNEPLLGAGGP